MNATEATANLIVAMINNKFISTSEEIAEAYKIIYKSVRTPYDDVNC